MSTPTELYRCTQPGRLTSAQKRTNKEAFCAYFTGNGAPKRWLQFIRRTLTSAFALTPLLLALFCLVCLAPLLGLESTANIAELQHWIATMPTADLVAFIHHQASLVLINFFVLGIALAAFINILALAPHSPTQPPPLHHKTASELE